MTPFEFAAIAYLAIPVLVFFFAYGRPWVGFTATTFTLVALWHCARLIDRQAAFGIGMVDVFFVGCAASVVFLSGSFGGGIFPNSDWVKHFAVFRFLMDNGTLTGVARGYDGDTMRYYLGWYVVPALLARFTSHAALLPLAGAWTTVGMYLFFRVVSQSTESARWRYALPLVFLAFSGADVIGTFFTGFSRGPQWHMEWWSGWTQYSSMVTDIFWAPQHAISAWLGIALAVRFKDSAVSLAAFPVVTASLLLWSPFSAMGVAPFYLLAMLRSIRSLTLRDAAVAVMMLAVTVFILRYLTAGADAYGEGLASVFGNPCLGSGSCYSLPGYIGFLAAEVLGFLVILHLSTHGRNAMLWMATVILLSLPFMRFGAANDLNLHASIPALALLPVMVWQLLPREPRAITFAMACMLAFGVMTPVSEIRRSFTMQTGPTPSTTMGDLVRGTSGIRGQYLISHAPGMLREPVEEHPAQLSGW